MGPDAEIGPFMLGRFRLQRLPRLVISRVPQHEDSPKTIELLLRPRMALLRCTTIPSDRFHAVPLHAPTVLVHPAEIGLSVGVALIRRTAKPADGFSIVLRHPATVPVHPTEAGLSGRVALFD